MRYVKYAALVGLLVIFSGAMAKPADAHVRVSIGIGVGPAYVGPPVCAFGYYPYSPYACAPRGYYGPEWFTGGVFIGAGPWFHGFYGPAFYGHRRFDFNDRGWRDFHDHDGWRNFRDGDRWRNFRGYDGRRDFRGDRRGPARRYQGAENFRGGEGHHRFERRDSRERGDAHRGHRKHDRDRRR